MISVLVGQDSFAIESYLRDQTAGQIIKFYNSEDVLPNPQELGGRSLFGDAVTYVFKNCFSKFSDQYIEQLRGLPQTVFLIEESLDKRTTRVKELLSFGSSQGVTIKEFPAPDKIKAANWIEEHAKVINCKITPAASKLLADNLMGETKNALPVWRAHQELQKLKAFAAGKVITEDMVIELVLPEQGIDLFKLMDAISNNRKAQAIDLLNRYYETQTQDEKAATIKLTALLADQWRSIVIVKDFVDRNVPDEQILKQTGWKSGRLYVIKKLAGRYPLSQILDTLHKLSALDTELKTSTLPSRVIVDMIITALT